MEDTTMLQIKKLTSAALLSGMLALGLAAAPPAEAQVGQVGLVNVTIIPVIGNVQVLNNVSLGVVANLCGAAQVGVIAQQIQRTGATTCTSQGGDTVQITRA